MGIVTPISFFAVSAVGIDPDAQAFIDAAGITDATQISAVNQLVLDLKADSLWSKFKAIYPFVGGTASTHKWNLVDPQDTDAAYRLVFNGGITHNSNGATGNGSTGYYQTHFYALTDFTSTDDASMFVYLKTNNASGVDFGAVTAGNNGFQIRPSNGSSTTHRCNSTTLTLTSVSNTLGLFGISRTASASYTLLQNTSTTTTISVASSAPPAGNLPGMAIFNGSNHLVFSSRTHAFSCIGDGLTSSECTTLGSIVQDYQTTLGRQV